VTCSNQDGSFEELLDYLKRNRGFDFTGYKRTSLRRRVCKRMAEVNVPDFDAYQDYLEVHPQEFVQLFNTILINVTSFFRDRPAWDYLADEIVPRVLAAQSGAGNVRVWSAGCATGEEAYSLAMIFAEALGMQECRRRVKIYATDVDEDALELARRGTFAPDAMRVVPEDLRTRYFDATNDHYTFRNDLRRVLIFGRHDLMHDAPISRLDLLCCRNTLIYFNREAQDRVVARFHFALHDTGYLFLGKAEMLLSHTALFAPEEMGHRFFTKISLTQPRVQVETLVQAGQEIQIEAPNAHGQLHRASFETAPVAQVVISRQGDLALANEQARATFGLDLRDLSRPFRDLELSYRPLELRSLINQARDEQHIVVVHDVERTRPDRSGDQYLDIRVSPLWDASGRWLGTSIAFLDASERHDLRRELEQSKHEVETTYEELQSTNEELETSNEELQSTVEELQTTNEELQSTNEEMETMNEELQSANAELQTMNDELHQRTHDLNEANAFLSSVLSSVHLGVIVLDRDFRVLLWNDRAEDLWGLRADEVRGRSLLNLDIGLPVAELQQPVLDFMAGDASRGQLLLEAINRRGQKCRYQVSLTLRYDAQGDVAGVVLVMEEQRL
jgi:two-component system CheB/CheR fusion protein